MHHDSAQLFEPSLFVVNRVKKKKVKKWELQIWQSTGQNLRLFGVNWSPSFTWQSGARKGALENHLGHQVSTGDLLPASTGGEHLPPMLNASPQGMRHMVFKQNRNTWSTLLQRLRLTEGERIDAKPPRHSRDQWQSYTAYPFWGMASLCTSAKKSSHFTAQPNLCTFVRLSLRS